MKGSYFTMKELNKLRIIHKAMDKDITQKDASQLLNISERQVRKIIRKIKDKGDIGIKHQNTFNKPIRTIKDDLKLKIIDLKLNKYSDTNFSHFKELLVENENINLSYSTIYKILTSNNIISKKHLTHKRKKYKTRVRKTAVGELLQLDASQYDWFSNGGYCYLHGSIDDASGLITGLYMDKEETTNAYFEIMKQTIYNYGIPLVLYTDGRTTFFYPKNKELSDEELLSGKDENKTQFTSSMDELGIEIIKAHSPQAKGRIERLWGTLQDRLTVLFKMNNITTIEQANDYLINTFIKDFNSKFSVEVNDNQFLPLRKDIILDLVLAKKYNRIISSGSSFSFNNKKYFVIDEKYRLAPTYHNDIITVIETTRGNHKVLFDNKYYNMIDIESYYKLKSFINDNLVDIDYSKYIQNNYIINKDLVTT